jgi:hypothetical protein
MRRVIGLILMIPASGVLVAGCGGGSHVTAGSAGSLQTAPITTSSLTGLNLRAADVAGMKAVSGERTTKSSRFAAQLSRCGGGLPGWEEGSLNSARFERTGVRSTESVASAVHISGSAGIAARRLTANSSAGVRRCLARVFNTVRFQTGPLVRESVLLSTLPTPLPGVPGSFGLKLTFVVSYRHASPAGRPLARGFVQDIIGFAAGPAQIALIDSHDRGTASPPSEQRLLSLLYRRALARRL